jgi:uncharacterized membrane protein
MSTRDAGRRRPRNVGQTERWISAVGGAALLGYSLRRSRLRLLLLPLGVHLVRRALTGHCELNQALGRNTASADERDAVARLERGEGTKLEQAIVVGRPRDELFRFWRQLDNLPRFMDHLESVTVLDERRSHWTAKGPLGARVEWDAEIVHEIPDEILAWRSLPGSDVDQAGQVQFTPAHGGGTDVRVVLRYATPAGKAGATVAHLLGDDPARQIADDLRRFKQVTEGSFASATSSGTS